MHRCSPRYRPASLSFWWNSRKLSGIFPKASVPYITNVQEDAHVWTLASVKTFIYANWVVTFLILVFTGIRAHRPNLSNLSGKNQDASLWPQIHTRILVVLMKQSWTVRYLPPSQCTIHYECPGRHTWTDARQCENIHFCELSGVTFLILVFTGIRAHRPNLPTF